MSEMPKVVENGCYVPAESTSGQFRTSTLNVATRANSLWRWRFAQDHAHADLTAGLDELDPLVDRDQSSFAVFGEIILSLYDLRMTALVFEDELKETMENLEKAAK
jgi:hypothetical protein